MPDILISAIAWQACYTNTCLHVFTIYNSSIKYIQTTGVDCITATKMTRLSQLVLLLCSLYYYNIVYSRLYNLQTDV